MPPPRWRPSWRYWRPAFPGRPSRPPPSSRLPCLRPWRPGRRATPRRPGRRPQAIRPGADFASRVGFPAGCVDSGAGPIGRRPAPILERPRRRRRHDHPGGLDPAPGPALAAPGLPSPLPRERRFGAAGATGDALGAQRAGRGRVRGGPAPQSPLRRRLRRAHRRRFHVAGDSPR